MNKVGITSGGVGDIIISIPIMRMLRIKTLYIKESFYPDRTSIYSISKRLLKVNGIEALPTKDDGKGFDCFDPAIKYDYNMDAWRNVRGRGRDYIGFSMMVYFRVFRGDWRNPWLYMDPNQMEPFIEPAYNVFFLTKRWREGSQVNWRKVYQSVPGKKYFIGLEEDWLNFLQEAGDVEWIRTKDTLEMANVIFNSEALYTNQSAALAIAQGLGHKYYLAPKAGKTNCLLRTPNENILL